MNTLSDLKSFYAGKGNCDVARRGFYKTGFLIECLEQIERMALADLEPSPLERLAIQIIFERAHVDFDKDKK